MQCSLAITINLDHEKWYTIHLFIKKYRLLILLHYFGRIEKRGKKHFVVKKKLGWLQFLIIIKKRFPSLKPPYTIVK